MLELEFIWRRIVFLQSARSALSSTSASPGRSGCETTWLQGLQGVLRIPLREQLAGRVVKLAADAQLATEAQVTA